MEYVERLIMALVLFLIQVLIMNHIHLFQVATPLIYIFFVVTFRRNTPKWIILTSSFVLGLLVDIFSNTPGLAAGSMTFIAMIQPYLMEMFTPRDSAENLQSSTLTLGYTRFYLFCAILALPYCLIFFGLESFSFFDWQMWLLRAVSSAALTMAMMVAIESFRKK